jgi:UDP-glucose 4-epimerase
MKYFITGGAGFIGSHLTDALIQEHEVTVFDNLSSGKRAHFVHHLERKNFRFIQGDLKDLRILTNALKGHDSVFHFASNPDIARGLLETDLDLKEGTLLTYNVLEAMRINGIKAIAYTSGSGIYGDQGSRPVAEDFGPLLPVSLYGANKLASEGLISAFCNMFDMSAHIFRLANVVGARQTHGVTFDFVRKLKEKPASLKILGDGTQSKSYIHVDDVIAAMLYVKTHSHENLNVYNVATDDYIDVTAIARSVVREMGLDNVEFIYTGGDRGWKGDVPVVRFDLRKIHELGWTARYPSGQAITKSVWELLGR